MPKTYKDYIKYENTLLKESEKLPEDISDLTPENIKHIVNEIEIALSPENLTSDGEASQHEINGRLDYYQTLIREINSNTEYTLDNYY